MKFYIVTIVALWASTAVSQTSVHTSLGQLLKTATIDAEFVMFDKEHSDRAFIRDNSFGGIVTNMMIGQEMDCFLANHAKDKLRATYQIYTREGEHAGKVNKAVRFVSLKSGDDTNTWKQKEATDSVMAERHHEALKRLRGVD